jgi:hypothetical protein
MRPTSETRHAFVQNLCGHYELATHVAARHRLATAFAEVALASDLGVTGGDAVHLPHQATGPLEVVRSPFVHAATSQCAHMITVYEWSTNRRRLMSAASAGPPLSLTQLAADRSVWALG